MKILVLYFSKGGNTKRLAEAIVEGVNAIEGAEAVLKKTDHVTKDDFLESRAIIAGSPVYFGTMAAQLKQVFDEFVSVRKKMENKIGAAFTTSGDVTGGKETTIFSIIQALMIYGMIIVGDPMAATGHYGASCVGKPDEKTMENGRLLGKRVAELALKMVK
jgi:NAD(P)H dehydrogenase (quinone)